ncbi:recombinase family protein [Propionivibrio sp.]|uniref:recombinase family protein n=1 Tax=Propionivibrio sp. TaxID=2212460 RepID=UPI0039E6B0B5
MGKKTTAIIYVRVSTEKQADEGLPIESQIEQAEKKAEQLGATVLRIFKDEGVSGRTSHRTSFQEAIAFCEHYKVNFFIVWNTSRFARNKIDAANYKKQLRLGGTNVVYVSGDIDAQTDEGWLLESFFEIVDEHYSRVISKDTRRSMMKNAQDGFFNGGRIPFGYKTVTDGKRKRLAIDENEAPLVREIFNSYLAGAGCKELSLRFNAEGRLKRGVRWNKNTLGLLLKSPVYAGFLVFNRVSHVDRLTRPRPEWVMTKSHPEIVTEEVFMTVQKLMANRAPREGGGSPHSRFVFSGLLRCGSCGAAMQTESATGRSGVYRYYNCRSALKGVGCKNRRIPAQAFDDWMISAILDKVLTPDRLAEIIKEIYELRGEWYIERERRRDALVSEIRDAERRRNNLFETLELHGKAAPNLGDLTDRLRQLKKQIEMAEKSLTKLEEEVIPEIEIDEAQIAEASSFFRNLVISSDDPAKLRSFFSQFIEKIVLNDTSVHVEYFREKLVNQRGFSVVHSKECWLPDLGSNQGPTD